MYKRILFMLVFLITMIPISTQAHVKWFTEEAPHKVSIEQIISIEFIVVALISALILGILPQLIPAISQWEISRKMDNLLNTFKERNYTVVLMRWGTAAALLIQVLYSNSLAPEIHLTTFRGVLMGLIIFLLLFPFNLSMVVSGLLLLTLGLNIALDLGLFYSLDYVFYAAIAVYFMAIGTSRYAGWGIPILYLGTGFSLCWVALEKVVFPMMALDVVVHHGVPTFGFSPGLFILMTAFIEFVVGYLLMVGVLNRLLSAVLTLIFISTTMLFGMTEIIGHFILHVLLIVYLIEGTEGFYQPPIEMHKRKIDQIIFVSLNFLFVLASLLLVYYRFA